MEFITSNPDILFGKAIIKGTRIPVYLILEKLSEGYSIADLIQAYPNLNEGQILACIKYASTQIQNETLIPS